MEQVKCPECGYELENEVWTCPNCGMLLNQQDTSEQPINKKKRHMGVFMCIIGCILFIVAITRINNKNYKFYVEHYETCMQGYHENTATANSYTGGLLGNLFKNSYQYIASEYKEMAEDDYKEIRKYRIQAFIFFGTGFILLVIGCINIIGKKNKRYAY